MTKVTKKREKVLNVSFILLSIHLIVWYCVANIIITNTVRLLLCVMDSYTSCSQHNTGKRPRLFVARTATRASTAKARRSCSRSTYVYKFLPIVYRFTLLSTHNCLYNCFSADAVRVSQDDGCDYRTKKGKAI